MKACFFDLDGTLADTRADLAATVNDTRKELGLEPKGQEEILSYVGRGAKYLLANSIPEKAEEKDKLFEIFMLHYGDHMLDSIELYPGVVETLEELKARGWKLGVNTAKPAFATHAIIEHYNLGRFFGNAVIAGGDSTEMKPSPIPLQDCSRRMGGHLLTPEDWMVGDNWTDIKCAANAGIKSAVCSFGFGILADSSPTVTITSFPDLLKYLL